MILGRHQRPLFRALLLCAAAALGSPGSVLAADPPAGDPAAGSGAPRTAILVYITWQELGGADLDPTRLRLATARFLAESLAAQGHAVVPEQEVAPLVARWRLRTDLMLRDEFLTALGGDLNADRLLVAQLFLQPERLLMAWRLVDVATGVLVRVGFSEGSLGLPAADSPRDVPRRQAGADVRPETGHWLRAAEQAARTLTLPVAEDLPRGKPTRVMLPVRSVGTDLGSTALATHSLLAELVNCGGEALPDPGLVVTALGQSGFVPGQMSAPVRTLLRERFGCGVALFGELISYEVLDSRPAPAATDLETGQGGELGPLDVFSMNLTEIDLESGQVLASREIYENRSLEFGWFGVQRRHSLLERLQTAVAELRVGTARQLKDGGNGSPR